MIAIIDWYNTNKVRFQKNGCKKGFELRGAVSTNITSNFTNITGNSYDFIVLTTIYKTHKIWGLLIRTTRILVMYGIRKNLGLRPLKIDQFWPKSGQNQSILTKNWTFFGGIFIHCIYFFYFFFYIHFFSIFNIHSILLFWLIFFIYFCFSILTIYFFILCFFISW